MAAEFLIPDDQQKISYAGFCNIKVDTLSKYLTLNPVEEDFKPVTILTASFDSIFIQEKNILCAFSDKYELIFAMIFKNEPTCSKVFEIIQKYKTSDHQISQDTHKKIFKEKFALPLIEQNNHNPEIEKIISILQSIYSENNPAVIEAPKNENLYQILKCPKKENNCGNDENKLTKIIFENVANVTTNSRPIRKTSKRPLKNINHESEVDSDNDTDYSLNENFSSDDEGNHQKAKEKKKKSPQNKKTKKDFGSKIIKRPDYETIEGILNGHKRTRLIIFPPSSLLDEKQKCYEYSLEINTQKYLCRGCKELHKNNGALIFNFDEENEYVQLLNDVEHICEPREYENLDILIERKSVYLPDYEIQKVIKNGIERKYLIIFELNNRELCYKYTFKEISDRYFCRPCQGQGKGVYAKVRTNDDGKEYIELRGEEHICILQPYQNEEDDNDIILEGSSIKYFPRKHTDLTSKPSSHEIKSKAKLFIFDLTKKDFGYEFSHAKNNVYQCLGCHRINKQHKIVTVKLCQKENDGEYYVRMRPNQTHYCKQRKYIPEKLEEKIILPPSFKFYMENENLNLVIFPSVDQKMCYDYQYFHKLKLFYCMKCQKQKVQSSAKVLKGINDQEYIRLGLISHVCDPIEFSSIDHYYEMLDSSGLKVEPQKVQQKIDETKIIKEENFELRRNKNGDPDSRLIVICHENGDLCYEYFYRKYSKRFNCCKCETVSAKISFDENGKRYLIAGDKEHTCEPIKYEPDNSIIKAPNYIVLNKDDSNKTLKLIIFTSTDRKHCYIYSWNAHYQKFMCKNCLNQELKKKYITAKIRFDENGNEYVQLSNLNHICTPKEYKPEDYKN